jgi:hypothetical protein
MSMYFAYALLVLLLVALILWVLLCFSAALQMQRQLNVLWERAAQLFAERDVLLGQVRGLWQIPGAPEPDVHSQRLQEMQGQDAETHWQEVEQRAWLRQQIDIEAQHVIAAAQQSPALAQQPGFGELLQMLTNNAAALGKAVLAYNQMVRNYNAALRSQPTRFLASRMGLAPAPLFAVSGK